MRKYNNYITKDISGIYVGVVPTQHSDKQMVSVKTEKQIEHDQHMIDICLNCSKPKCTGTCENFRRHK